MTEYKAGDRVRVVDPRNWANGRTVYIERPENDGYRVRFSLPTQRKSPIFMWLLPSSLAPLPDTSAGQ